MTDPTIDPEPPINPEPSKGPGEVPELPPGLPEQDPIPGYEPPGAPNYEPTEVPTYEPDNPGMPPLTA